MLIGLLKILSRLNRIKRQAFFKSMRYEATKTKPADTSPKAENIKSSLNFMDVAFMPTLVRSAEKKQRH